MIRTFRSRVDKFYHAFIWIVVIILFYCFWHHHIIAAITTLLVLLFGMEALLKTEYIISTEGYLIVKCGFFPTYSIKTDDIKEVRYVTSCAFAYALSCDRIQIVSKNNATRTISPENTDIFIKELKRQNHLIVVLDNK